MRLHYAFFQFVFKRDGQKSNLASFYGWINICTQLIYILAVGCNHLRNGNLISNYKYKCTNKPVCREDFICVLFWTLANRGTCVLLCMYAAYAVYFLTAVL